MYKYDEMIDVSSFQGSIDWKKVKQDGVNKAIIRLGFRGYGNGTLKVDKCAIDNILNAIENGVEIGIYFFSTAKNSKEVIEECDFCFDLLVDLGVEDKITLNMAYDFENYGNPNYRTYGITKEQRTENCKTWCKYWEDKGYKSSLYGSQNNIANTYNLNEFPNTPIWCAKYYGGYKEVVKDLQYFPIIRNANVAVNGRIWAWQYTSIGNVNGIKARVDRSLVRTPITENKPSEDKTECDHTDEIRLMELMRELKELLD